MDWIDLVQDREQWRALVNMVRNCRVQQNVGEILVTEQLVGSQKGLSSFELAVLFILRGPFMRQNFILPSQGWLPRKNNA
jgi:hypothetical protein